MDETSRPDSIITPTQQDTASLNEGAIEWFYDVAIDPLRMETLIDEWERSMAQLRNNADFFAPDLLSDRKIMGHFERAKSILAKVERDSPVDQIELVLSPFKSVSAFVLDAGLKIQAANDTATVDLALENINSVRDLPLESADIESLLRSIRRLFENDREDTAILSCRPTHGQQIMVFRLQLFHTLDGQPMVLLAANGITWPNGLNSTLTKVFGLTPAETDVLRSLVESGSINDIAIARGRSVDTIRGQIKSLMAKTETRSQVELVRLTMSIMGVSGVPAEHDEASQNTHRGYATLEDRAFQTVVLQDGRRVDYLLLGDPKGRPILYLSAGLGLIRWPARAEAEAANRGMRVIVPLRPGYGGSDPVADDVDYTTALVSDAVHILDAEKVEMCPILSIADDSFFAFEIARTHPKRVRAMIATAGSLPMTSTKQFERMHKWHRFMYTGAKYTPHLLPFMARSASYMTQKIGKRRLLQLVFGQCSGDVAAFENAEVFEALSSGSEVMMSESRAAHTALARQFVSRKKDDWSSSVDAVRDKLPVIFMNGTEDQQVPMETLAEFQTAHPWIDWRIFEGSGNLLFFQRWRDVLDAIEPYTGNDFP